jgi:hypothetical protein
MANYRYTFQFQADNEDNAKKKILVIQNILENVSENALTNVLFNKIQKNPNYFNKLADNPLLKML